MRSKGTGCHLKARVTANYISARPLEEDSEDLELQDMMSERDSSHSSEELYLELS